MRTHTILMRRWVLSAVLFVLPVALAQTGDDGASVGSEPSPDTIVARLGDRTETLASLQDRFEIAIRSLVAGQGMAMSDEIRAQLRPFLPQYLEQRASELVLLAEAERRGFTADEAQVDSVVKDIAGNVPDGSTLDALLQGAGFRDEAQLRTLVSESNLINQVLTAISEQVVLTDDQIKLAYQGSKASYTRPETICASHILVATEDEAKTVMQDLAGGADFAEEAKAKSTDPGAANGGDLGCFERTRMVEPFAEAAFGAPLDTPVGPVKTEFGYHVILVREHDLGGVRPLSEVRDQVEKNARQEQADKVVTALVKASGVHTYPERLPAPPAAAPAEPDASAQPAGPADPGASGDPAPPAGADHP